MQELAASDSIVLKLHQDMVKIIGVILKVATDIKSYNRVIEIDQEI